MASARVRGFIHDSTHWRLHERVLIQSSWLIQCLNFEISCVLTASGLCITLGNLPPGLHVMSADNTVIYDPDLATIHCGL